MGLTESCLWFSAWSPSHAWGSPVVSHGLSAWLGRWDAESPNLVKHSPQRQRLAPSSYREQTWGGGD